MATVLAPHPASRQGGWVAPDTRMCTGWTVSHCPHPVLPQADSAHGTAWGSGDTNRHSPPDKHRAAPTRQCKHTNAHQRSHLHKCLQLVTSHCPLHRRGAACLTGNRPWYTARLDLPLPALRRLQPRSSKEHAVLGSVSAIPSNTPCQLGRAGLRTSPRSRGMRPSARSASQHQQHTRGPLRTEKRDSVTQAPPVRLRVDRGLGATRLLCPAAEMPAATSNKSRPTLPVAAMSPAQPVPAPALL